jgi:hypothetical protein
METIYLLCESWSDITYFTLHMDFVSETLLFLAINTNICGGPVFSTIIVIVVLALPVRVHNYESNVPTHDLIAGTVRRPGIRVRSCFLV